MNASSSGVKLLGLAILACTCCCCGCSTGLGGSITTSSSFASPANEMNIDFVLYTSPLSAANSFLRSSILSALSKIVCIYFSPCFISSLFFALRASILLVITSHWKLVVVSTFGVGTTCCTGIGCACCCLLRVRNASKYILLSPFVSLNT